MTDSSTHLYSPGLVGIIATESSVSNINGKKGILSYRGYSIEELAQKSTFEETSYLLLFGELPTLDELKEFTDKELSTGSSYRINRDTASVTKTD